MSNNRTFFKEARAGQMSLRDIFSDVTRKHTRQETARVFISGTELTTPAEADMLAGWQKPFLFARFFLAVVLFLALAMVMNILFSDSRVFYLLMIGIAVIMPFTLLILVWEMNVPRNISLYDVILLTGIGGVLSLIATYLLSIIDPTAGGGAIWAPVTEEPAKLLIIYLVLRKRNYKFTLNGVLIGAAVGAGFAFIENLFYTLDTSFIGSLFNGASLGTAFSQGISTALLRASLDIPGHCLWAALYGGGLMMAKGAAPVSFSHFTKPVFLKYFCISFLLHMLRNSGILSSLTGILLQNVIMIAVFLPMLRSGVNQVVEYTARLNGGRVTLAVNRQGGSPRPAPHSPVSPVSPASPTGRKVLLECISGPNAGQVYECPEGGTLTLGRVPGQADVVLSAYNNVSSTHCQIRYQQGAATVTDMASTNGTFLGNRRLMPRMPEPLKEGDTLSLANFNCSFRIRIR